MGRDGTGGTAELWVPAAPAAQKMPLRTEGALAVRLRHHGALALQPVLQVTPPGKHY